MKAHYTTVTSKGQVVIPAKLREKLGIGAGTRIAVREENGRLIFHPITDAYIDAVQGLFADAAAAVEVLHEERRKEYLHENEELRLGRKRAAGLSRATSRRSARQRSA